MKPKSKESSKKLLYGVAFPEKWWDLQCLLWLFQFAPRLVGNPTWRPWPELFPEEKPYSGDGRFQHAKQISEMIYGKAFEWHDWSEKIVRKACETQTLCISGPGASGKSTSIALYALLFWQCSPLDSAVIIASKTIESSKKRIWREISRLFSIFSHAMGGYKDAQIGSSPRPFISPVDPKTRKKDEAHGLYVTALHGKALEQEMGYIRGFHPRRILVVADELDVLEEGGQALVDVFFTNLMTGTIEAVLIGLGNDPSLFNALGNLMQPEIGKPLQLEHTEWTSAKAISCLRLDAWDSPNIRDAGKWTGLVGQKDIDAVVSRYGENSPYVWIQLHGLHPPEGSEDTVVSEALIHRFHAFDKVSWRSSFIPSASLDSGFGGDPCVFRTFRRGEDDTGQFRVACDEIIELPVDASDRNNPPTYQIGFKVIELCKARGIPPDEFAIGSTGIGMGVSDMIQRHWSSRIITVEEAGAASDYVLTKEDPRPAREIYDRKVTELWFSVRQFIESGILRNLDVATAHQLCNRRYEMRGAKYVIEKKEDMKTRGLSSPNEADALVFYIHMLKERGIAIAPEAPAYKSQEKQMQKTIHNWDWDDSPFAYSEAD